MKRIKICWMHVLMCMWGIGLVVDLIQYTVYYFVRLIPYPIVLAINIFFLITKILDIHIYNLSEK